jgi:ubiquinone/menaquinone biosynthesis C-methylase UbiE
MNTENKKELIHDYNGRDYRTVWQHARSKFEDIFETRVQKKLLTQNPGWFIDVGGGYGRSVPLFKQGNRKHVLVDYAHNLLEYASDTYKDDKSIFYVAADAYHLPFKDNVFCGGLSVRVMHHMNMPVNFLKEINRVMMRGSKFVMDFANKRNLFRIFAKPGLALKKDHEEYEPLLFGTHPGYFRQAAKEAGFKTEKILGTGFFPRFITEKTEFLSPVLYVLEVIFDNTLGLLELGPRSVARIKKEGGEESNNLNLDIKDILACPTCKGDIKIEGEAVTCTKCNNKYAYKNGIFDFRKTI